MARIAARCGALARGARLVTASSRTPYRMKRRDFLAGSAALGASLGAPFGVSLGTSAGALLGAPSGASSGGRAQASSGTLSGASPGVASRPPQPARAENVSQGENAAARIHDDLLILVELKGGNDGLNTVVPYADPLYYALRPHLGVPRDQVLPLDARTGLHPALAALMPLWQAGQLALVQGVGYAQPSLSHFRSAEIWESASDAHQYLRDGWLARAFAQCASRGVPVSGIAFGSAEAGPFAGGAHGKRTGSGLPTARGYSAEHVVRDAAPGAFLAFSAFSASLASSLLRGSLDAANVGSAMSASNVLPMSSLQVHFADAGDESGRLPASQSASVSQATSPLVEAATRFSAWPAAPEGVAWVAPTAPAASTAALVPITSTAPPIPPTPPDNPTPRAGIAVVRVTLHGFDTHHRQQDRHAALLRQLAEGFAQMRATLIAAGRWDRTLIVTYSEFGRAARENASGGTDHGAAAPLLVAGGRVRGGLYGAPPRLAQLDANGGLRANIDLRQIYATVLGPGWGLDPQTVLRQRFEPLPFLRPAYS